jgi:hypothetical protein
MTDRAAECQSVCEQNVSKLGRKQEGIARDLTILLVIAAVSGAVAWILGAPVQGAVGGLVAGIAAIAVRRLWPDPDKREAEGRARDLEARLERISRATQEPSYEFARKLAERQDQADRYGFSRPRHWRS